MDCHHVSTIIVITRAPDSLGVYRSWLKQECKGFRLRLRQTSWVWLSLVIDNSQTVDVVHEMRAHRCKDLRRPLHACRCALPFTPLPATLKFVLMFQHSFDSSSASTKKGRTALAFLVPYPAETCSGQFL